MMSLRGKGSKHLPTLIFFVFPIASGLLQNDKKRNPPKASKNCTFLKIAYAILASC
jgi:hypothetical protein